MIFSLNKSPSKNESAFKQTSSTSKFRDKSNKPILNGRAQRWQAVDSHCIIKQSQETKSSQYNSPSRERSSNDSVQKLRQKGHKSDFSFADKELSQIIHQQKQEKVDYYHQNISKAIKLTKNEDTVDLALWKNAIFYKSIALIKEQREKLKQKIDPNYISSNIKPKVKTFRQKSPKPQILKKQGNNIRCKSADVVAERHSNFSFNNDDKNKDIVNEINQKDSANQQTSFCEDQEEQQRREKYLKYTRKPDQSSEQHLLVIISKFSPFLIKEISDTNVDQIDINKVKREEIESLANCFMQLVNLIIYERQELSQGWEQLQAYCHHSYDAFQHFLILKSCADLQKFGIESIVETEKMFLNSLGEVCIFNLPKCLFILYQLCQSLINYIYDLYGYTHIKTQRERKSKSQMNRVFQLELIEEINEDDHLKTPKFFQ
ncbi:UNKNOWN [Stylonychia lemnae]|uniref:Uncharacterized protein n=1 Tax=Stylonychia lemnae TaxID=5949 RepID=A0A078AMP8_STYLE|nr:UNKNOWN [Stylonychia lemnae]|eukprot:CDW83670.1 UNKNOWN [Stylonychia lemnae]